MSDNNENIESENYQSDEDNEDNNDKLNRKKGRVLGKRVSNKPKPKRSKYQSKVNYYI